MSPQYQCFSIVSFEYPNDTHDVSHKNTVNHIDRSLACHLNTNAFPLSVLSIPYDTSVPTSNVYTFLFNVAPIVRRNHIQHSHRKPFISIHDGEIDNIPSLSSPCDSIIHDENDEDVCTRIVNAAPFTICIDTHIDVSCDNKFTTY